MRAQPGGATWNLHDARLHALGLSFQDCRAAEAAGAVRHGETFEDLARICDLPADSLAAVLAETLACAAGQAKGSYGRDFTAKPVLQSPYYAVKVTDALFHTQGGLVVDAAARVLRPDGTALPNLFAGGGAACGVSGSADWGYLSGNGLLPAVMPGRIAGTAVARRVLQ